MTTHRSLRREEAEERAAMLTVERYDVHLDLTAEDGTFRSVTTITFTSAGGPTFVEVRPVALHAVILNGRRLDPEGLDRGRLLLPTEPGGNRLVVDATLAYRKDGEGLHRSVDPADGRHYVYAMCFMDAAPSVFACFDQPDLKAAYRLRVRTPREWTVIANSRGRESAAGDWDFEETPPLSTYFVTLVAGPWHVLTDHHDGIPLGVSSRRSIARHLDVDADELFTLTKQCFDEFHRLFGIRYPFGDYHQAFVPEFNAGAMENPGCVTFRDPMVFSSRVTRGVRINRATTVAHEMAHQWFGNLTTPRWWDDLWLNESFAEYLGNRVTADVTQFRDAWTHHAYARRQWGLVADQRPSTHPVAGNGARDASSALQDFDGISYAKGSSVLKLLNAALGDEVFFGGLIDHFTRHRFGNATMHDLFASWERAGGGDLGAFVDGWLRTAGLDTLSVDRVAGVLHRACPAGLRADRVHTFLVAEAVPGGRWQTRSVTLAAAELPYAPAPGAAVVLDPYEQTWAQVRPDRTTLTALPALLPTTADRQLRAGIWNNLRSGFHDAAVAPSDALAVVEAGIPVEEYDDAVFYTMPWAIGTVAPLADDPPAALRRIHASARARLRTAPAGSPLQLAAFQAVIASAADADRLTGWLDGSELPLGMVVDADLRWRLLVRLAVLGGTDRDRLRHELRHDPTAHAEVEHTLAVASLPDPDAKEWAWRRFTGEADATNYQLEAAGNGLWRHGQQHLTRPYVGRYFAELPATAQVRSGWILAEAAVWFFPLTALDDATLGQACALAAREDLDPGMRRTVGDMTDELRRRLTVRRRFGGR